jgi:Domain of unknown function (DUF1989)
VTGDACAHVLLYNADQPWERLNVANTVKIPWQAYLTADHPLLSCDGRVLATFVRDEAEGHHDALCDTTTAAANNAKTAIRRPRARRRSPRVSSGSPTLVVAAVPASLRSWFSYARPGRRDKGPQLTPALFVVPFFDDTVLTARLREEIQRHLSRA